MTATASGAIGSTLLRARRPICPPNVKPDDCLYYLDFKEKMFGLH